MDSEISLFPTSPRTEVVGATWILGIDSVPQAYKASVFLTSTLVALPGIFRFTLHLRAPQGSFSACALARGESTAFISHLLTEGPRLWMGALRFPRVHLVCIGQHGRPGSEVNAAE